MPSARARTLSPAAVVCIVLAVLVAGCSGDGPSRPRLVVGDGLPPDQWGELPDPVEAGASAGDGNGWERQAGDGADTGERPSSDDSEAGDDGSTDEGAEPAPSGPGPLVQFELVDGATFRVVEHADGADWSLLLMSADAGDWIVVVDDGAGGEYPMGSGEHARPDSWTLDTGATLAFCDRSSVDGVTGTYIEVRDVRTDQPILRERIQGPPC